MKSGLLRWCSWILLAVNYYASGLSANILRHEKKTFSNKSHQKGSVDDGKIVYFVVIYNYCHNFNCVQLVWCSFVEVIWSFRVISDGKDIFSLQLSNFSQVTVSQYIDHGTTHSSRLTAKESVKVTKSNHDISRARREKKAFYTLGHIVLFFLICWIPFYLYFLVNQNLQFELFIPQDSKMFFLMSLDKSSLSNILPFLVWRILLLDGVS